MITKADTCRKYVLPKLNAAEWDTDPHSFTEQETFTDGRLLPDDYSNAMAERRRQAKRH